MAPSPPPPPYAFSVRERQQQQERLERFARQQACGGTIDRDDHDRVLRLSESLLSAAPPMAELVVPSEAVETTLVAATTATLPSAPRLGRHRGRARARGTSRGRGGTGRIERRATGSIAAST